MDDKEMIATLRLMSRTHDGDKPRVRWTWDETRKGRCRLIEDWPDETPVIALEAKRWKGCLPAPYIAEMHNNLPRLLELAEAGLRGDAPSAAVEAELRARQEQINALTAEKLELKDEVEAQEAVQHALKDEAHTLETDLNQARRALDAIWRRSHGPFDDRNRLKIQNIAAAYKNGGPKPARAQVAQWMEDTNAER